MYTSIQSKAPQQQQNDAQDANCHTVVNLLTSLLIALESHTPSKIQHYKPVIQSKFDVLVILPSLNESKTIQAVTSMVDKGCNEHFAGLKCLLFNADCGSDDNTQQLFLSTSTKCDKDCVTVPKGKGNALKAGMYKMLRIGAKYAMCFDTDLESPSLDHWIASFSTALRTRGADYVVPSYKRHRFDATITNLVVRPIVRSVWGKSVMQPIGGEFGWSRASARAWLKQDPWPEAAHHYGVDIFMTATVLTAGLRVVQVELPPKIHAPSAPKLPNMGWQVIRMLLLKVNEHKLALMDGCSSIDVNTASASMDTIAWTEYEMPALRELPEPDSATLRQFVEIAQNIFEQRKDEMKKASCEVYDTLRCALRASDCRRGSRGEDGCVGLDDEVKYAGVLSYAIRSVMNVTKDDDEAIDLATVIVYCGWLLRVIGHLNVVKHMSQANAAKVVDRGVRLLLRQNGSTDDD